MRHALYVPPFGPLADAGAVRDVAAAADEAGWDGLFLWDHVLRPPDEPSAIADPWICLAAAATVTRRLRLGPMVTPVTRRRPQKLAREVTTLDHLSAGRVTVGLGLGVDHGRELSAFGEIVEARTRAARLDEGATLLAALLAGEHVQHHGEHFTADDVRFAPGCVQQPRVPLWFAARGDALAPVRRAARFEGLFPIEVDEARLGRMLDVVVAERGSLEGFDVAVVTDPDGTDDLAALARRGATWAMHAFAPGTTAAAVLRHVERHAPVHPR